MKRSIYKPLGLLFLGLGLLGIPLPLLPSTPFILLAAWFFARSSETWHRRLLDSDLFGPMIRNWERDRCLSCRTKVVALLAMFCAGGTSLIFAVDELWLRALGLTMMGLGCVVILSIRTCGPQDGAESEAPVGSEMAQARLEQDGADEGGQQYHHDQG